MRKANWHTGWQEEGSSMCQSHVNLSPSLFRWGPSRRRSTTENKRTFCAKRLLTAEIAYRKDNTRRPTVPTQWSASNASLTDTEPVTTSVRLFQKRTMTPMSTTPAPSLPRPRTPRTKQTNVKQTSKTRPLSPTTQPDSTRRTAPHRTVNRCPLQQEAAAHDARTAPTPPVTTRWNAAGHPQVTLPRQTDEHVSKRWPSRRVTKTVPVKTGGRTARELHVPSGLVWRRPLLFGFRTWELNYDYGMTVSSIGDLFFWPQWTPEG